MDPRPPDFHHEQLNDGLSSQVFACFLVFIGNFVERVIDHMTDS